MIFQGIVKGGKYKSLLTIVSSANLSFVVEVLLVHTNAQILPLISHSVLILQTWADFAEFVLCFFPSVSHFSLLYCLHTFISESPHLTPL